MLAHLVTAERKLIHESSSEEWSVSINRLGLCLWTELLMSPMLLEQNVVLAPLPQVWVREV